MQSQDIHYCDQSVAKSYYGDIEANNVYVVKNHSGEVIFKSENINEVRIRARSLNEKRDDPKAVLEILRVMEITGNLTISGYDLIEDLKDQINAMPVVEPSEIVQFGNETIGGNTYNPADYEVNPCLKSKKISEW